MTNYKSPITENDDIVLSFKDFYIIKCGSIASKKVYEENKNLFQHVEKLEENVYQVVDGYKSNGGFVKLTHNVILYFTDDQIVVEFPLYRPVYAFHQNCNEVPHNILKLNNKIGFNRKDGFNEYHRNDFIEDVYKVQRRIYLLETVSCSYNNFVFDSNKKININDILNHLKYLTGK